MAINPKNIQTSTFCNNYTKIKDKYKHTEHKTKIDQIIDSIIFNDFAIIDDCIKICNGNIDDLYLLMNSIFNKNMEIRSKIFNTNNLTNINQDSVDSTHREYNIKSINKSHKIANDEDTNDEDTNDEDTNDEPILNYSLSENKYFQNLNDKDKKYINLKQNEIEDLSKQNTPLRFKILKSSLDIKTKKNIIDKINRLSIMEENDNEYGKLNNWIEEIDKIPFDKYSNDLNNVSVNNISDEILKCKEYLDDAVYGHYEAKLEIIKQFVQLFNNSKTDGKILALQGPMGNGKTTLIKNGFAKALNKPHYFIALGGANDCNYINGFSSTYEGSQAGCIVNAIQRTGVMDPIIIFDELDKVSETKNGLEIYNLLCHITDSTQNSEYQDKYLGNIKLDLSKVTFVFSFNNIEKISPILLDRLNIIKTNGFELNDKLSIAKRYIIPNILDVNCFKKTDLIISDESIKYIINRISSEKGVRNLKKNLEKLISHINLLRYLPNNQNLNKLIDYEIITMPYKLNHQLINKIIKTEYNINNSLYI